MQMFIESRIIYQIPIRSPLGEDNINVFWASCVRNFEEFDKGEVV